MYIIQETIRNNHTYETCIPDLSFIIAYYILYYWILLYYYVSPRGHQQVQGQRRSAYSALFSFLYVYVTDLMDSN